MTTPDAFNTRLSDAERNAAMEALGQAFAEGRITIDEYDERCQSIASAKTQSDLAPVFADIPRDVGPTRYQGGQQIKLYSAMEIDQAYRNGKRTRFGVFALSSIGAITLTALLDSIAIEAGAIFLLVIPVMYILLYIMKIGPAHWFVPSPAAVERQRMRELRAWQSQRSLERRMAEEERLAQLRFQRKEQTQELTNRAMEFVNRALEKRDR